MFNWLRRIFGITKEAPDPMKYLITGIGNMGAEYDGTRHNIGFDVVDALAKEFEVSWKGDTLGDLAEFRHKGRTFILLKPSTYVNLSGKSVRYWLQKKKVQKQNLLVVLDDMNLEFGKMRLRAKGTDGGHNGLKDINQMLGSDYARLRIGIGNAPKGRHVDFVLGKWDADEVGALPELLKRATDAVKDFSTIGLARTMDRFNR